MTTQSGPRPMTEKELQAGVEKLAKTLGWKVMHHRISQFTEPGWPDLFMLRGRRALAIELKRGGKDPTPAQAAWLAALAEAGIETDVWRPDDIANGHILAMLR